MFGKFFHFCLDKLKRSRVLNSALISACALVIMAALAYIIISGAQKHQIESDNEYYASLYNPAVSGSPEAVLSVDKQPAAVPSGTAETAGTDSGEIPADTGTPEPAGTDSTFSAGASAETPKQPGTPAIEYIPIATKGPSEVNHPSAASPDTPSGEESAAVNSTPAVTGSSSPEKTPEAGTAVAAASSVPVDSSEPNESPATESPIPGESPEGSQPDESPAAESPIPGESPEIPEPDESPAAESPVPGESPEIPEPDESPAAESPVPGESPEIPEPDESPEAESPAPEGTPEAAPTEAGPTPLPTPDENTVIYIVQTLPPIQDAFEELLIENPETIGWLENKTWLHLPVVQRPNDNLYYLTHNFSGNESPAGALFLDGSNVFYPQDDLLLIYGHNMKNGTMFHDLETFLTYDSAMENSPVTLNTLYSSRDYLPYSSFSLSAEPDDPDYIQLRMLTMTDSEKMEFIRRTKELSAVDYHLDVGCEDYLLALITCEYSHDNGRLVVLFRSVRDGELD